MKKFSLFLILVLFFAGSNSIFAQQNKIKISRKAPKISISFLGGFSYVLSKANGDASGFKAVYNSNLSGGNIFTANDLGMQQGYGALVTGKYALGKKRKLRVTGSLGYNLFYNKFDSKRNRTMWNIFNIGPGIEYNFDPKQKERLYVGYELNYSLMFGAWQSDIVYPDGFKSNIYTKFKPSSRLGMAITAGMEFRVTRKMNMVVALRGVWSNLFPKNNYESSQAYETYMNDSGNSNNIQLSGRKDILFMQIVTGISLPVSYK